MELAKDVFLPYTNLDNLTKDIIELAQNILPNKVIYINFLNNDIQMTLKVSRNDTKVTVTEGEVIPVINALCNTIDYTHNKPLIIENTRKHSFPAHVDETVKNGNIGSYVGVPILFKNGERFGALCAAHHDESIFDASDVLLLQKIANLFSYYLELERQAYVDTLTGIENTRYLVLKHAEIMKHAGLSIMLDLDNFKSVNDTFGHHVGDEVLREVSGKIKTLTKPFRNKITVRLGGDEFWIFIKDKMAESEINTFLTTLVTSLSAWKDPIKDLELSTSVGAILFTPSSFPTFNDLYEATDALLYESKKSGKNNYLLKSY